MKTLLLAAGRSKRFSPLTEKSLFPVCGTSLLGLQVQRLHEAGLRDITIVCGSHNRKEIKRLFPECDTIEQKDLELGMQGALLSALPRFKNGPVLIVSGNDVIESSAFAALLEAAKRKETGGAILAQKVKTYFPGGYLTVKAGRITGVIEKPGTGNEPSNLVNIVAHAHNEAADLLAELKSVKSKRDDGYEQALTSLFATKTYRAVPYTDSWQAVKYPWHLLPLLQILLQEITAPRVSKSAEIHPSSVIEGNVIIEDGAKIFQHATVIGPCFIGRDAVIGTGALVRSSSIGEKCVVGFGSEVKGSILQSNVWTHMTYIGDSVIGDNVSFGGGTITGNLRLDEGEILSAADGATIGTGLIKFGTIIGSGCRLGIRVGINPGIKIGGGTFIAGGTYVSEDIPAGSFVIEKEGKLSIRPNKLAVPVVEARAKYVPKHV
jgi:NDP-sugar pyrophosphorylase family protein